jgi:hypothetical protein
MAVASNHPRSARPFVLAAKLDTDKTIPTLERASMVALGGATVNRFPDQKPRGMYPKSKRISTITSTSPMPPLGP